MLIFKGERERERKRKKKRERDVSVSREYGVNCKLNLFLFSYYIKWDYYNYILKNVIIYKGIYNYFNFFF